MRTKQSVASLCLTCALVTLATAHAQSPTETILHTFEFFPGGFAPCATLIIDPAGNLYGTTNMGGADGIYPYAGVSMDAQGNLYGTTAEGGASGVGVIYKITR